MGAAMASCWHEMAGQPCPPTKLKYLAVTVMTAASTVHASEERTFSRTCKSRVLCRYPGPRESVHIKLLVSPVSFSHNIVRLLMVYWGERERVPPWEFNAPPVCLSIYILRPSFLVPPWEFNAPPVCLSIYIYISYVRHFWSRGPRATRKRKPAHLKFKGHMHACCIYVANASRAITTLIERLHMYSSSLISSSAG